MYRDMSDHDRPGARAYTRRDLACLDQLVEFVDEYGRLPETDAPSPVESGLGRWLMFQQSAAAAGAMDERWRARLDEAVPEWMPSIWAAWLERARRCSDFVILQGRLPSFDGLPAEALQAAWLETQIALATVGELPAPMAAWLSTHLPGWDATADAGGEA